MPKFIDLTGRQFGQLTVTQRSLTRSHRGVTWDCLCSCGKSRIAVGADLRTGDTKSCGCLQPVAAAIANMTHGATAFGAWTPEYKAYAAMIARCFQKGNRAYPRYGGRGITVCDRWRNHFDLFRADMGPKGQGMTLERVDNNKGYSPENCQWATMTQQARNRSNNRALTHEGVSRSLAEWAEVAGLPYSVLYSRINCYGWDLHRAIQTPSGKKL